MPVKERKMIPIDQLRRMPENVNEMEEMDFNDLVAKIKAVGFDQEVNVWWSEETKTYDIIKGNHRYEAARYLGYTEIPCCVSEYSSRDEAIAACMSDNLIRGKINPDKFAKEYLKLKAKYGADGALKILNVSNESRLKDVVKELKKSLSPEMGDKLEEAAKNAKTIEDLSFILNKLFSEYGETVKYGFMFFQYGGETHLMVQMDASLKKASRELSERSKSSGRDLTLMLAEACENWLKMDLARTPNNVEQPATAS